ncbi:GGDEF domain-containing protein [Uliginosibacterium sp. H1]|uniref:GGDEF domain-containing protein n=1 Tax=Uliginosibacterium sp. H1 TaxID=3114757 RepID=UPI002E19D9FD|nr:diguanylate cyclase [Uliginosibacterium sp. H1]
MPEQSNPSEIAREVLRRLATQRIPPTPENFREFYNKISGAPNDETFPERQLKMLAASLPRATPEQLRLARRIEVAIQERNWNGFRNQMINLLGEQAAPAPAWSALLGDLLAQLERRQAGLSETSKREALEHVLQANASDADLLFTRLQGLVRGWAQAPSSTATAIETLGTADSPVTNALPRPVATAAAAATAASASLATAAASAVATAGGGSSLLEVVAATLDNAIGMLLIDTPELADESKALARELRTGLPGGEDEFLQRLQKFAYRVQWVAQDQSYIRQALLNLLQLVIENIGELVVDDKWLSGQMSVLLELFGKPLDKDIIEEVRERLRDVIFKQGTLKRSLSDAQSKMREMLASFVERLSELADSTGVFHGKMEVFAGRVSKAHGMDELSGLIEEIISETRHVQTRAHQSQAELTALRTTVDQAYREIARLEGELETASELVRHDPLTGALNRKGLEETIAREIARMRRRNSPLCMALLDIDNFKQLNDTFGHATGDEALRHIAGVVRENLRPQDSCGRYGGEEFVILLPDTVVDGAVGVLTRLQRELTKRFFLADNRKLLITFSAGVTQMGMEEEPATALDRADQAMYRAKRAGKNRVEAG